MNAAKHQSPLPGNHAIDAGQSSRTDEALSALFDSEVGVSELDAVLVSLDTDHLSSWHAHGVIGEVIRGHRDSIGTTSAIDFLAAVRIGITTGDAAPDTLPQASMEAVASATVQGRREAANDAVFRWKLVAGFASLAAVMAVSWSVVSGSGSALDRAAGAQLASSAGGGVSSPVPIQEAAVAVVNVPVVVNTGQGVVIRDTQLEALLAEHRQHGGMSALQMPSGFIRNATYEAAGR